MKKIKMDDDVGEFAANFRKLLEDLKCLSDVKKVKALVDTPTHLLTLLQWRYKTLVSRSPSQHLLDEDFVSALLRNRELLALLLTSGDVLDNKWCQVVNILQSLVRVEKRIVSPEGSDLYVKRLAVAVALTFSTPVKSFASYDVLHIDAVQR